MENKLASKYIRRVSRRMPVGGIHKKQFLANLQEDVNQYLEEHPEEDMSHLDTHFGSPDDIAADFISQMSYRQINDKFRFRNRVVTTVLVVSVLFVTIWAVIVTLAYHKALEGVAGYWGDEQLITFESKESSQ